MDIKKIIKKQGLSVQEVADRMGISRIGLSQHINGNPSVEVLDRIAKAIGCEVGDFFTKSDDNVIQCPNCGKPIRIEKGE